MDSYGFLWNPMDSYGFLKKAESILILVTNLAVPPDLRSVGQRLSYYPNVSKYPEVSKYPPPPVGAGTE